MKELGFLIRSDVTSSELWVTRPAGGEDFFVRTAMCLNKKHCDKWRKATKEKLPEEDEDSGAGNRLPTGRTLGL